MNSNDIVADFQIIGSRIVDLSVKNDFVRMVSQTNLKKKIDISHKIVETSQIEGDECQQGVLQLFIGATLSEGKGKIRIKMTIEGCFLANSKISSEKFEDMLSINGITALYGIARAQLIAITSQTFAEGSVMLPMINVVKYSKNIASEKDSTK